MSTRNFNSLVQVMLSGWRRRSRATTPVRVSCKTTDKNVVGEDLKQSSMDTAKVFAQSVLRGALCESMFVDIFWAHQRCYLLSTVVWRDWFIAGGKGGHIMHAQFNMAAVTSYEMCIGKLFSHLGSCKWCVASASSLTWLRWSRWGVTDD